MSVPFLLEIGTEEIPARMIPGALEALQRGLADALSAAGLPATGTRALGTPRRLALVVEGIPEKSPDQSVEVTGPPASAAFDAQGRPTKAGEGFARAQGVKVEDLRRTNSPKGECIAVRKTIPGRRAAPAQHGKNTLASRRRKVSSPGTARGGQAARGSWGCRGRVSRSIICAPMRFWC